MIAMMHHLLTITSLIIKIICFRRLRISFFIHMYTIFSTHFYYKFMFLDPNVLILFSPLFGIRFTCIYITNIFYNKIGKSKNLSVSYICVGFRSSVTCRSTMAPVRNEYISVWKLIVVMKAVYYRNCSLNFSKECDF